MGLKTPSVQRFKTEGLSSSTLSEEVHRSNQKTPFPQILQWAPRSNAPIYSTPSYGVKAPTKPSASPGDSPNHRGLLRFGRVSAGASPFRSAVEPALRRRSLWHRLLGGLRPTCTRSVPALGSRRAQGRTLNWELWLGGISCLIREFTGHFKCLNCAWLVAQSSTFWPRSVWNSSIIRYLRK